jgi:hypothetical protein
LHGIKSATNWVTKISETYLLINLAPDYINLASNFRNVPFGAQWIFYQKVKQAKNLENTLAGM